MEWYWWVLIGLVTPVVLYALLLLIAVFTFTGDR